MISVQLLNFSYELNHEFADIIISVRQTIHRDEILKEFEDGLAGLKVS